MRTVSLWTDSWWLTSLCCREELRKQVGTAKPTEQLDVYVLYSEGHFVNWFRTLDILSLFVKTTKERECFCSSSNSLNNKGEIRTWICKTCQFKIKNNRGGTGTWWLEFAKLVLEEILQFKIRSLVAACGATVHCLLVELLCWHLEGIYPFFLCST